MDERSQAITAKAGTIAFVVGFLYMLVLAIWKFITYRSIEAAAGEIIFIVGTCSVFAWFLRDDQGAWLPRVTSEDPDELLSPQAHQSRIGRYALSSLGDAALFVVVVLVADWFTGAHAWTWLTNLPAWQIGLVALADLALTWLVFFLISWITKERAIRRYATHLKELDS